MLDFISLHLITSTTPSFEDFDPFTKQRLWWRAKVFVVFFRQDHLREKAFDW